MPTYSYYCKECNLAFEEFHSMSETVEKCKECGSSVDKLIAMSFNIKKNTSVATQKPGAIVKEYIKAAKREVKNEKTKISTKDYKEND